MTQDTFPNPPRGNAAYERCAYSYSMMPIALDPLLTSLVAASCARWRAMRRRALASTSTCSSRPASWACASVRSGQQQDPEWRVNESFDLRRHRTLCHGPFFQSDW